MNDFHKQMKNAAKIKEQYPKGTKIYIDYISDNSYPNAVGQHGKVDHVDDAGQVFCSMENGAHATVCKEYGDVFFKVS